MAYINLFVSLALLIIGGNVLVSGSVILAKRLKVSPLLIGLLLIGFGTSIPELMTSLFAVAHHSGSIAIGNIVGSNIANILLVLGICATIRPINIHDHAFGRDAIFLGLSAMVLLISLLKGVIGFEMGALMCMTLAFYVYHAYQTDKDHQKKLPPPEPTALSKRIYIPTYLSILLVISGLILTLCGANFLVRSTLNLSAQLGISEAVIGLTVIALGTSLPELTAGIVASLKNHSDVALGNIIGANIYNSLFILGFTALFMPVLAPPTMKFDVLIMTFATLALLALGWFRGQITRSMGITFIIGYLCYIGYLGFSP